MGESVMTETLIPAAITIILTYRMAAFLWYRSSRPASIETRRRRSKAAGIIARELSSNGG